MQPTIEQLRYFLKDTIRRQIDFGETDQHQGIEPPPLEKPFDANALRLDLPRPAEWNDVGKVDLSAAIARRESHRVYRPAPLALDELAFLLWATQGVRSELSPATALRTVPSAGCRHAIETYLGVMRVGELQPGIYRYLPLEHQLLLEHADEELVRKFHAGTLGQAFVGSAAVVFVWTAIPYRMEWRYDLAAHKVIAIDVGHICQNLYLACEAIGAGTCAVAAYHQEAMDQIVHVDGDEEFTIYLAPVGKV
jgi:SagB-type dehydrogenase family enzyme